MTLTAAIIITVLAVILSALFSGSEIAYVQSNKVRVEIDASRGGVVDRIIKRFAAREDMFISTLLVGNNVVLVVYGITFSLLVNPLLESTGMDEALVLVCNTILSTGIILLLGEFLPKTVFQINPNVMMRCFALPLYLIYLILYPVALLISWISRMLMKLFGLSLATDNSFKLTIEQLDDYIEESLHSQPDKTEVENEVKIFRNAIDFKDTEIGECMIPRNEIVAVDLDDTDREQLVGKFISTGRSKIVVYKEDIDNVVGYIHVSELLDAEADWKKHLKPVIFTPETMLANKMMHRMMAEKRSLAIVIDEFGGTAGMATLEDLVEEIFGEIEDEHDRNRADGRRLPDGSFEFPGRAEIETINDKFDLGLRESDGYQTLAGYILAVTEALPSVGDEIEIESHRFKILQMSTTKIELVKVTPLPQED